MAMNEMDVGEMMQMTDVSMESEPQQNPIEIIKADHRKVEGLFQQFENAKDNRQKLDVCKQVCLELKVHAEYEEELVYPLLLKEDEETGEEAELEHELIKFMIGEMEGISARDKKLEPKMKVLKELVQHHVEEEESTALPELEDNEELQSRTQEILARKQELMKQMQKGGRRSTAARKPTGGRKTAARSTAKKSSSTSVKKAAAGRKGGMSKVKKSSSSSRKAKRASRAR